MPTERTHPIPVLFRMYRGELKAVYAGHLESLVQ